MLPSEAPQVTCFKADRRAMKVTLARFHSLLSSRARVKASALPSIFTVGGLTSLEGVSKGTLSHTHLGSDTVALNETRRLCLGLAFQSQTCMRRPCGDAVANPTSLPLDTGVKIKKSQ